MPGFPLLLGGIQHLRTQGKQVVVGKLWGREASSFYELNAKDFLKQNSTD